MNAPIAIHDYRSGELSAALEFLKRARWELREQWMAQVGVDRYRLVDVKDADGNLVITHKGTIEKRAEIDPEAAAWIVRGAEMIAREGKSPIELARLFNRQKVGGRQTWSDNMIRKLYSRERLVGRCSHDAQPCGSVVRQDSEGPH